MVVNSENIVVEGPSTMEVAFIHRLAAPLVLEAGTVSAVTIRVPVAADRDHLIAEWGRHPEAGQVRRGLMMISRLSDLPRDVLLRLKASDARQLTALATKAFEMAGLG